MEDHLCNALAIELGSTDFNSGNLVLVIILVSCYWGLITVDKEASTMRLINFTLKEYLLASSDIFSRPYLAIAEICLTYDISADQDSSSLSPLSFLGSRGSESFFRVLISILRSPSETGSLGQH